MNTLESALLWPIVFILISFFVLFGVKALTVTDKQIDYYGSRSDGPAPAEITHLVEVAHDTLEELN